MLINSNLRKTTSSQKPEGTGLKLIDLGLRGLRIEGYSLGEESNAGQLLWTLHIIDQPTINNLQLFGAENCLLPLEMVIDHLELLYKEQICNSLKNEGV